MAGGHRHQVRDDDPYARGQRALELMQDRRQGDDDHGRVERSRHRAERDVLVPVALSD
jgi:hypothetical protein